MHLLLTEFLGSKKFQVDFNMARMESGFQLIYRVKGPVQEIKLPPQKSPSRKEGLWRETCFEIFMSKSGSSSYAEWNFSPSLEWCLFSFKSYREKLNEVIEENPLIQMKITLKSELEMRVNISASNAVSLTSFFKADPIEILPASILELHDGSFLYYAPRHQGSKPDFHDRACFLNFDTKE